MFQKIMMASRAAWKIATARELFARGDGLKAMEILRDATRELGDCLEGINYNLLRSQIAIQIENGPLALSSAETALAMLKRGDEPYNVHDRAYLISYAQALIHYCETWKVQRTVLRDVDLTDLPMDKVSDHLKKDFLMPEAGSFI